MREYLTRVRLDHAAELIRHGVKIEAVALSVGYRSKKNFYEQFKRRYGTTPVPYRDEAATSMSTSGNHALGEPRSGPLPGDADIDAADDAPQARQRFTSDHGDGNGTSPEPVLGRLGTIIRESKRAWRLAATTQQIMVEHFMQSRVPMLLTDDSGRYVGANAAATSVTGYSMGELHQMAPAELFPDGPHGDTRCVWHVVLFTLHRSTQPPNASIRAKDRASRPCYLVTLKNMLWGRREMSELLEQFRH